MHACDIFLCEYLYRLGQVRICFQALPLLFDVKLGRVSSIVLCIASLPGRFFSKRTEGRKRLVTLSINITQIETLYYIKVAPRRGGAIYSYS